VTVAIPLAQLRESVAALLRGDRIPWAALEVSEAEFLDYCIEEDLVGLVHRKLRQVEARDCPPHLKANLERAALAEAAREILRQAELSTVLEALAASEIRPVLFKGAALAYQIYDSPALRPRIDTDLLIRREDEDAVREVAASRGYEAPPYCDGELLFCQFELKKSDKFGIDHVLDFHWKVSMQTLFADLLTFDEIAGDSITLPALGPYARSAGVIHALLLACVHPVMHHRNAERLIWIYDVHLLASRLSPPDFREFVDLAIAKGVGAICAHELRLAKLRLGTVIPDWVIEKLDARGNAEPTTAYLDRERRWHDELVSNVRGLRSWRERVRLLREVALPSPHYMLQSYGRSDTIINRVLLPALYAHRGIRGMLKVVLGKK
jgi:hypothetical protein